MAIEYVSELGDKLSKNNTAANLPKHIKVISAPNYQRTDNGVVTNPSLQTALDGKAASTHSHGNITSDGKVGTTANKPLITTTGGAVTTGSFGTSANTFCQGNDSRLSDARTPTAHASTATTYGVGSSTNYGHVKLYDNVTGSNTDGAPTQKSVKEAIAAVEGGKVKATAKSDNVNYKLLATASASPTSGALTEAVYDTDITLNPSTNTLTANLSGVATYAKALDPQMILNTTLYKVPVISADKEVRWSGAPGASGSTTELTYDNTDSKNLLSVNVTGYATSLEHAFAGSTVNETPIINVSGSTDGFKLTYGATTSDLGITKLYTTDDANAKLSFGNMVSSTYKEAISIANGSATVTGSLSGNASTATSAGKLTTARKSYVNLGTASTSSTFDWSGDTVLPINGTLAVGHGGTGKTSVTANNFLVGNGTSALVEKTPAQVLSLIDAVSSSSLANVAFSGKYSSLTDKPSLTNDYIILDANTTIYVSINYIFNSAKKVGSLLTNVHMKGGTYAAWNNDSIEVLHSIGTDVYGTYNITNHILSYTLKSDIEFSYYLSSYGTLILKLKNNTSNDYRVSVSATVLDSSDDFPDFYKITGIEADTTAIAQSGTATNVWFNHALVSEKIGKTNSATTGIDYTSKGNTSTPIYLDNGEFKECTSISTPYEWVTAFPSTYTAGKVYLL